MSPEVRVARLGYVRSASKARADMVGGAVLLAASLPVLAIGRDVPWWALALGLCLSVPFGLVGVRSEREGRVVDAAAILVSDVGSVVVASSRRLVAPVLWRSGIIVGCSLVLVWWRPDWGLGVATSLAVGGGTGFATSWWERRRIVDLERSRGAVLVQTMVTQDRALAWMPAAAPEALLDRLRRISRRRVPEHRWVSEAALVVSE